MNELSTRVIRNREVTELRDYLENWLVVLLDEVLAFELVDSLGEREIVMLRNEIFHQTH